MKKNVLASLPSSLAPLALLLAALPGCGLNFPTTLATGEIDQPFTVPIPVQTIQGAGALGAVMDLSNFEVPVSSSSSLYAEAGASTQAIFLKALAIRTVLDDNAKDKTAEELKDPRWIGVCRPGQKPISWLHKVSLSIQKTGRPETRKLLAHYEMPESDWGRSDVCGFALATVDDVNMKDFLPDFETIFEAEGKAPSQNTQVSGFVSILYRARVGVPEQPAASPSPTPGISGQPGTVDGGGTPSPKPSATATPGPSPTRTGFPLPL